MLTLGLALAAAARAGVEVAPGSEEAGTFRVRFRFRPPAPGARRVAVAGSFNNWDKARTLLADPDGDGTFEADLRLPRGRHSYKFVVDGTAWHADPDTADRLPDGHGGENSLVFVGVGREEDPLPDAAPRGLPGFKTPEWVRDAVFYQIFPDRFRNGEPANDPDGSDPWGATPRNDSFSGGDLRGVIDRLDYIRSLGANALYLNPIFLAASNHKYDTADYRKIDPAFGSLDDFKALCDEAHDRGMRVILDGVFNHTGDEFFAFEDLKKNGKESKYVDWYFVREFPIVVKKDPAYECWWGFGDLPKLNVANEEVRRYLLETAEHWIRAGADGWRLDVPNELPHDFWVEFRRRVKRAKPQAYIVGEIWQEATPWLLGDQFDAVMNYPLRDACVAFLAKREGDPGAMDAAAFDRTLARGRLLYPEPAVEAQFNLLSSHDTARFRTVAGGGADGARRQRLAFLLTFAYVGAPVIYYGDEVGLEGEKDPDCRRCFPWADVADKDGNEEGETPSPRPSPGGRGRGDEGLSDGADRETLAFVRRLGEVRAAEAALRRGGFRTLAAASGSRAYAFARGEGRSAVICVLNAGEAAASVSVPVDAAGLYRDLLGGRVEARAAAGRSPRLELTVPPLSGMLLTRSGE